MMSSRRPLRFDVAFESKAPDEAATIAKIKAIVADVNRRTLKSSGRANRAMHAKTCALLTGEIVVKEGLSTDLAQGIFQTARTYPVVMRFSTLPAEILNDQVVVPRGLSLKVVGVAGDRLPGSETSTSQDFVLIDAPAFFTKDAKAFIKSFKLLALTTYRLVR